MNTGSHFGLKNLMRPVSLKGVQAVSLQPCTASSADPALGYWTHASVRYALRSLVRPAALFIV